RFSQKRDGVFQLIAPFYHEDGDMLDVYMENLGDNGRILISDHGMTLMRLSYEYDIDTPNKERIFQKILSENQIMENDGRLYIETTADRLYPSMLQFTQALGKVSNMRLFKREVIKSLFYEMLDEFIIETLSQYRPVKDIQPIEERDDLEVDYQLSLPRKSVYLFGVRDSAKARLTTISCLEFQKAQIPFKSLVVHENFEELNRKDRQRITSAADKQFIDLDDFKNRGEEYLKREAA
ncbi:MAG: DUF1828 domain-containing protein, partial [Thermodesulfobacteriota bacterium]